MTLGVNGNALTLQFGLEQHGKTSTRFTLTDILDFTASSKDIRKPKDSVTLKVCTFVVFCISSRLAFASQIFHYAHFIPLQFHPVIT